MEVMALQGKLDAKPGATVAPAGDLDTAYVRWILRLLYVI